MLRLTGFLCISFFFFISCSSPKLLLRNNVKIDTLHLELDMKIVQNFEYREALTRKMTKFVEVYNTEQHPFKLALNTGSKTAVCNLKILRVKFVTPRQSALATGISAVGVGTAATLILTGFPIPVGWVYIPNARTTLEPRLSNDISDVTTITRVGIISTGMYRRLDKQIEKQSTKFVKYVVSVVQTVEQEYLNKPLRNATGMPRF
jgi:hypothetical protein